MILFARDESRYAEALNDMRQIINSKRYDLLPGLFPDLVAGRRILPESIMEFVYTEKANSNDWGGYINGVCNNLPTWCSGRGIVDPRSAEEGGLGDGWGQATVSVTCTTGTKKVTPVAKVLSSTMRWKHRKSGTWVMR